MDNPQHPDVSPENPAEESPQQAPEAPAVAAAHPPDTAAGAVKKTAGEAEPQAEAADAATDATGADRTSGTTAPEAAGAETEAAGADTEAAADTETAPQGEAPAAAAAESAAPTEPPAAAAETEQPAEPAAAEAAAAGGESDEPAEPKAAAAEATAEAATEPAEAATEAEKPAEPEAAEAEKPGEPEAAAAEAEKPAEPEATTAEAATAEAEKPAEPEATTAEAATAEAEKPAEPEATAAEAAAAESEETAAPSAAAAETEAEAKPADAATAATAGEAEAKPAEGAAAAEPAEPPPEEPPEVKALRAAKEAKTPIEGKVIGWNRGGFHVAVDSLTAFCPNSEMEVGRPKSPNSYVDRTLSFLVLKVQKRGRRVVLSRSALLREERQRLAAEILPKVVPGAVLEGKVSSLTDFGAFVDLGGIEGLVHVSELSRRRVGHPKNAVELGQEVKVKVLKVEEGGDRISLSMKELEPDPWRGVAERYPRGSQFTGKVVRKTDFGAFVELEPEVDGLIHLSRLAHGMELDDPALETGKEVTGWVQDIDGKRQRISLSLREVPQDDPWKSINETLPEGSVVEGTVESTAPFGVFINLRPGLTGLLPTSEMNVPRGTSPGRLFAPGQKATVQVVTIDTRRKRISLAPEGAQVEGSRSDYQAYKKRAQESEPEGLTSLAAAFAKLKKDED